MLEERDYTLIIDKSGSMSIKDQRGWQKSLGSYAGVYPCSSK